METVELYFDGVLKECKLEDDRNGEYLFVAEDGSFVKFPSKYEDGDSLEKAIERYNKANDNIPDIIPDVEYGEVITFDSEGNEVK